ncbi:MAG: hypothetical protein ABUS57_22730 [Pseudomonadota bacterium]
MAVRLNAFIDGAMVLRGALRPSQGEAERRGFIAGRSGDDFRQRRTSGRAAHLRKRPPAGQNWPALRKRRWIT